MRYKPRTIALLISTYNWKEALELVLTSVQEQSMLPTEILIADDGSREDTKILINQFREKIPIPIKHIWHEDKGFRKTVILNKAIHESESEYIIQIDGDIILHPHFIKDHFQNAQMNYFVKGSRSLLTKEKTGWHLKHKNIRIHTFQKGVKSSINGTRMTLFAPLFFGKPKQSRNTKGCNFAFWKKDFISINGYNNDLLGWGHEDIEIAARFVNKGVQRRQLKMTAVCFHLYHNNSNENRSDKIDQNFKVYLQTVQNGIFLCENGYQQSI